MFDENGDRQGLTQIEQLQDDDEVQVGVYNPASPAANKISWHPNQTVFWKGRRLSCGALKSLLFLHKLHSSVHSLKNPSPI